MTDESNSEERIFEGIRVVDFTHVLAGPSCTMHMADLGAEVIKVERPVTGDRMRVSLPSKNGVSGFFMWRNGGKKSISLNMEHPKAVEIFKDLVRISDVVVQNMKVGLMDSLGIGYEDLKKINPRIILCSISGFGQYGPFAEWPGWDLRIQAMSGAMAITGHPDGPPLPCWVPWVDSGTGTQAFAAISAALYHRERTGRGKHIDVSMLDLAFTYHDFPILEYLWSDGKVHRTRQGPMHPTQPGQAVFACKDGYLAAAFSGDDPWRRLTEVMDRPELATDPRFDTLFHRDENKQELIRTVSEWIKGYTVNEAHMLLEAVGVLSSPILSIEEVVNHPQIQVREMVVEVDDPRVGRVKLPNTAFRFSDTKPAVRGPSPRLGEHNEEVLLKLLGYTKERVEQLWEEKVLYAEEAEHSLADS